MIALNGAPLTAKHVEYLPLTDHVLIEEVEQEHGLIAIPDGADVGPRQGRVVAVGPGRFEHGARVPTDLEVGDLVYMFSEHPFVEIPLGGKTYNLIRAVYLKMKVK